MTMLAIPLINTISRGMQESQYALGWNICSMDVFIRYIFRWRFFNVEWP